MTHLPFIAATYALFLAFAAAYTLSAGARLRRAEVRLRALDRREAAAR